VVVVVTLFGQSLSWPRWVQDLSPLTWTPDLPAEEWTAGAGAALLVGALALLAVGFGGMRRRDLTTG
jgi:ABC-2 type transport system permease protein